MKFVFANSFVRLLALAMLCTSCSAYRVSTNTFVDIGELPRGFPIGASFAIISKKEDHFLFSKEVESKIAKILLGKGFIIAEKGRADYFLAFDFDSQAFTETVHVLRYLPEETKSTKGNIRGKEDIKYQEEVKSSGNAVYIPVERTFFTKNLNIFVYDAKLYGKAERENEIWRGSCSSTGSDKDLRQVLDFLIISVFEYFGKSTHKNIDSKLSKNYEAVQKLRECF